MPTDKKKKEEKEIPLGDGLAGRARKAIKSRQSQLDAWERPAWRLSNVWL